MKTIVAALIFAGATLARADVPATFETEPFRAPTAGSTRAADSLIIAGQIDRVYPASGGGGSVDWLHASVNGATLSGGVASYALGDSRWTFGRAGGAARLDDRFLVHGQASLGGGRTADSHFAYRLFSAGAFYGISPTTYLKGEDQYVDIGTTRGHLLKAGIAFLPLRDVTVDIGYARSAGGNLNSEFVATRVDWQTRYGRILGGLALGRSVRDLFNIDVGSGKPNADLRELFVGVAVPIARAELTIVIDVLGFEEVRRRTLTLSLKVPLRDV